MKHEGFELSKDSGLSFFNSYSPSSSNKKNIKIKQKAEKTPIIIEEIATENWVLFCFLFFIVLEVETPTEELNEIMATLEFMKTK